MAGWHYFDTDFTYGAGGSATVRLGLYEPTVNSETSSVTIRATGWVITSGSLSDSVNSFSLTGTVTASGSNKGISHGGSGGTTEVITSTVSISPYYSSTRNISGTFTLVGVEAFGTRSASGSFVLPRRPYGVPSVPASPSVTSITDDSAYVYWNSPSDWGGTGEDRYDAKVTTDLAGNNVIASIANTTIRNWTATGLPSGTPLYAHVRAENIVAADGNGGGTSGWSTPKSFTTTGPSSPPSTPAQPSVTSITDDGAYGYWTDPTSWGGAVGRFDAKVTTDAAGNNVVATKLDTTEKFWNITGLAQGTDHWLWVRAENGYLGSNGGTSSYSIARQFKTVGAPGAVQSLALAGAGSDSLSFTWSPPASNGGSAITGYDWELYEGADALGTLVGSGFVAGAAVAPSGLSDNTQHFFQVQAKNAHLDGSFTGIQATTASGAPALYVKISGVWTPIDALYVKVSGTWRIVEELYVKVSGTWRQVI